MEKKLLFLCLVGFPLTVVCGNFLSDPPLQGDHYFFYAQYDSAVIHYREAAARINASKSYHEYSACAFA